MPSKLPPRKDKNRVPRQKREIAPVHKDAERVAKVIARAGLGSRREIEEWIADGRVAVNGTVLESPAFTVTAEDRIEVDGAPLPEKERTRLFLYHKPRGVVTTNRDPEGRTTLFEILPGGLPRLVSIGRLDLNSEGLLLLTNDGGLARVLELPETGWLRRYRVRAKGEIDQAKLDTLLGGITVDGISYGPIEATLDRVQGANAWLTVSLREGKNREVRNVLAGLGMAVNRLIRVSYGPFQLGEIPENGIEEVRTRILRDQIGGDLIAASGADFDGPLIEREIEEAPRRPSPPPAEPVRGARRGAARPAARQHDDFAEEDAPARPRGRRADPEREVESRGTVADRKGRTVKVERVKSPRTEEARSARGAGPKRGRPGGEFGEREERPARRGASGGFADRPRREDGPARPPRRSEGREGFGEREDRPARRGPSAGYEGRPRREDGPARPPRRSERREDFGDREERPARRPASGGYEGRPRREEGAARPPRRTERRDFGTDRDDASPKRRTASGRFESREERPARSDARPPRRPAGAREEREDFRRGSDRPDKRGPARGGKPGFGDRPRRDDDAPRSRAPRTEGDRPRAPRRQKDGEVGFFGGDERAPRGRAPGGRDGAPKGAGRSFSKDGPRSAPRGDRPGKPAGRPAGKGGSRPTGGKPGGKPGGSRPPRKRD